MSVLCVEGTEAVHLLLLHGQCQNGLGTHCATCHPQL